MSKREGRNFTDGTIWTADNLEIMRGINSNCIDLIYLDPPFNSNTNYEAPVGSKAAGAAFKDAWTLNDVDAYEHGELADRNPAAYSVIEAASWSHGKSMMSYLIFMAVRLLEMERILKKPGSIWLHCDDTAGAYLKILMDGIFGKNNYRNTITWKRSHSHNDSKKFARISDTLLFYSGTSSIFSENIKEPLDEAAIKARYTNEDARGKYMTSPLHARGLSGGGYTYDFHGEAGPWKFPQERMLKLEKDGLLHFPANGKAIRRKVYLLDHKGVVPNDLWIDLKLTRKERTGYPTQKPLSLLERIIKACSNKGDVVFDPFCGCATTLVAADRLQRRWAGIDLSEKAIELVETRIKEDRGDLPLGTVNAQAEPPKRTDQGKIPNYRSHAHMLYGLQEGICNGCETHFPFKIMEVDHIIPKSKGGTDHSENLQLLCSHCNRSKGDKTMAEWKASS